VAVTIDIDPEAAKQRSLALHDACDMCRRAASAIAAAACGEPDALREAVLQSVHVHLNSLLAQLRALA
jgi:hypothetical protein